MSLFQSFPKLTLNELKPNLRVGIGSVLLTIGTRILWRQWREWRTEECLKSLRPERLIVISGCDSGLGFAMAYWAARLNYRVIAGCLDMESHGSQILRKEFGQKHVLIVQLDVTKSESLQNLVVQTAAFLQRNSETNLRKWFMKSYFQVERALADNEPASIFRSLGNHRKCSSRMLWRSVLVDVWTTAHHDGYKFLGLGEFFKSIRAVASDL